MMQEEIRHTSNALFSGVNKFIRYKEEKIGIAFAWCHRIGQAY
jgi:hypothetical protein